MKTLNHSEFKAANFNLSTYQSNDVQNSIEQAKEISKFHPAEPVFRVSEYDGKLHFEGSEIRLAHSSLDFRIRYTGKKYSIFCQSIHHLKNIDHSTRSRAAKDLTEPNQIGVLTTKKIQAWISYCETLYNKLTEIDKENLSEKETFLKSIEGLPVRWHNSNKSGEIIQNGILFKFEIGDTYISKRIELYYTVKADISTFLKLSDNKLNA